MEEREREEGRKFKIMTNETMAHLWEKVEHVTASILDTLGKL